MPQAELPTPAAPNTDPLPIQSPSLRARVLSRLRSSSTHAETTGRLDLIAAANATADQPGSPGSELFAEHLESPITNLQSALRETSEAGAAVVAKNATHLKMRVTDQYRLSGGKSTAEITDSETYIAKGVTELLQSATHAARTGEPQTLALGIDESPRLKAGDAAFRARDPHAPMLGVTYRNRGNALAPAAVARVYNLLGASRSLNEAGEPFTKPSSSRTTYERDEQGSITAVQTATPAGFTLRETWGIARANATDILGPREAHQPLIDSEGRQHESRVHVLTILPPTPDRPMSAAV